MTILKAKKKKKVQIDKPNQMALKERDPDGKKEEEEKIEQKYLLRYRESRRMKRY